MATVTNTQESFFKAITKVSTTIEAVDPAEPKAEAVAPAVVAPVEDKTKTVAPMQAEDKIETERTERNWLRTIGTILLGIVVIIALGWLLFNKLAMPITNSDTNAPASAPAMAPVDSALESPDQRSAGSNQNFIGYFGSRGAGWIVPTEVSDTSGNTRKVGSVLYTWCETRWSCFYQILKPGDTIKTGHQGSQINIYSPEYIGFEAQELMYIQTEQDTNWTIVQ